ncbi:MAG: type II secretion system F family protein, partial [Clostridiales bacterium]|nr:type II secretion system F family protein [Clostridiales bacterium]
KQKIEQCKNLLEEGVTFSSAVEKSGIFTGLEIGLISAGFRAGSSEAVMQELARRCHNQTEDIMSKVMSRIEPLLIVILVFVVGMLLLSVMMPLLSMMESIGS